MLPAFARLGAPPRISPSSGPRLSAAALAGIMRKASPTQLAHDVALAEAVHARAETASGKIKSAAAIVSPIRAPASWRVPANLRRRPKVFGDGAGRAMVREAKVHAAARARQARIEGRITRAAREVHDALLWHFHNARAGLCFPSYEAIATVAGCARSTVATAIRQLEAAGLLTWVHRIRRVRVGGHTKVVRTSNAYSFTETPHVSEAPPISKSDCRSETQTKTLSLLECWQTPNPIEGEHKEFDEEGGVRTLMPDEKGPEFRV